MEAPLGSESSCVDGRGSREGESKKPDFIHVSSNRRVGGLGGNQLLSCIAILVSSFMAFLEIAFALVLMRYRMRLCKTVEQSA